MRGLVVLAGIDDIASSVSVETNTSDPPMCDLCEAPSYIIASTEGELRGTWSDEASAGSSDDSD